MKIFIAGQKAFGAAVFELCRARGHQVVGVCAPAHRRGGTAAPLPDRLRQAAEGAAVPWLPAGTLNAEALPPAIDLIIAAHAHDFIGRPRACWCGKDHTFAAILGTDLLTAGSSCPCWLSVDRTDPRDCSPRR